jgi:hypothetical protein
MSTAEGSAPILAARLRVSLAQTIKTFELWRYGAAMSGLKRRRRRRINACTGLPPSLQR